jgi:8-oxo-dGTP pyrophosphatase MutT (NUDIX family)
MTEIINKIDSSCLKKIIRNSKLPQPPADATYQSTCVFLLLFGEDEPLILAIQKSDREGYPWRNQVALPGGHVDPKDAGPVEAVYRELEEELNISPHQVELIGSMGHFQTINHKDIEVFIGLWNGEGPVRFDSNEISRVLEIPLKIFVKTHIESGFQNRTPATDDLEYPLADVVVWGVTARILHYFIELLYPHIAKDQYQQK